MYLLMIGGEVCGTPAVYRCADVLSGSYQDGAEDQERDGVAVVQSVDDVVVVARVQLEHGLHRRQQTVNHLVDHAVPPGLPPRSTEFFWEDR